MKKILLTSAALCAFAVASPAAAEIQLGFHLGWNKTFSSDVTFTGPGTTDFTLEGVPWQGLSLPGDDGAPYYGGRATYWFNNTGPGWGVMLDYTHAKIRADASAMVALTGDTGASGVAPGNYTVPVLVDRLEFTDGINLVTLSAMYRFAPTGKLQPYVGFGGGMSIPHVEVTGNSLSGLPTTFEYNNGGLTVQALAGVDFRVTDIFSVYGEYRLNYSPVSASLSDPAFKMETDLLTNQIAFGVSLHF
ncbi:MAG: hypothetical protein DHS20C05_11190 [Hyphococcus sp.]|nr:MAG: hypothetical protein DHS20C05_11190 [Marinicaulis sp.]